MPSRMVINTESTVGYNKLKRATSNMKLKYLNKNLNSDVNADGTVEVGIRHNFGVSKVKLPYVVLRKATENVESLADKTIPKTEKNTHTT